MREQTSLKKVHAMVAEMSKRQNDQTFPASCVQFEDFSTVEIDGQRFGVMDSAKRLIAQRLRIPRDYLDRCPPHLQEMNLNYWVGTLKGTPLFMRFRRPGPAGGIYHSLQAD